MKIDISKEREDLLKILRLKLSFLKNFVLYSIILPFSPIFVLYIEYLFIKSIKSLESKLKPLNIKLYDNSLYLLDYVTIFYTYVFFLFGCLPFYSSLIFFFCNLGWTFIFVIIRVLLPNFSLGLLLNYISYCLLILVYTLSFILIILLLSLLFLRNKSFSTLANICESFYRLTNVSSFKELSDELLNPKKNSTVSQYKYRSRIKIIDIINNQKEIVEKFYKAIEQMKTEVDILEVSSFEEKKNFCNLLKVLNRYNLLIIYNVILR